MQYFVFAYDSPSIESVRDNLISLQNDEETHKRIDSICVLDKGVVVNMDADGMFSALPTQSSIVVASSTNKPLLYFYALVSIILNQADMLYFNFALYIRDIRF